MLEWDAEKLANFSAAEEKLALNGLSDAEKVAAETAAGARGMVRSGIVSLSLSGFSCDLEVGI